MKQEIKVTPKTVYGRELIYPACDTAKAFASLLNVKTFNDGQLMQIEKIGYNVVNASTGLFYFTSSN